MTQQNDMQNVQKDERPYNIMSKSIRLKHTVKMTMSAEKQPQLHGVLIPSSVFSQLPVNKLPWQPATT